MSNVIPFVLKPPAPELPGYTQSNLPCRTTLEFSDGGVYQIDNQFELPGAQAAITQSLASTRLFQLQMILMESPDRAEWINAQLERIIHQVYKSS